MIRILLMFFSLNVFANNCPNPKAVPIPPPPPPNFPSELTDNGGVWRLVSIRCNDVESTVFTDADLDSTTGTVSSTVSFSGNSAARTWLIPSCSQSVAMSNVTNPTGYINVTQSAAACSGTCPTEAACSASAPTVNFPYTLSGGTLSVEINDYSPYGNPCGEEQSGPIIFNYVQ